MDSNKFEKLKADIEAQSIELTELIKNGKFIKAYNQYSNMHRDMEKLRVFALKNGQKV